MTEVADATQMLHKHVHELYATGRIDTEEKQRLHDEIRAIRDDLEYQYDV